MKKTKKIIYIDLDGVVVDYNSVITTRGNTLEDKLSKSTAGIFGLMKPIPGAIEAVNLLSEHFDLYFLSTSPWNNPSAWTDKMLWIKTFFPVLGFKRLILSHHKNLNEGDYLIDDRTANGAGLFGGEHIHFNKNNFKTWEKILEYIGEKENVVFTFFPFKYIQVRKKVPETITHFTINSQYNLIPGWLLCTTDDGMATHNFLRLLKLVDTKLTDFRGYQTLVINDYKLGTRAKKMDLVQETKPALAVYYGNAQKNLCKLYVLTPEIFYNPIVKRVLKIEGYNCNDSDILKLYKVLIYKMLP